MCKNIQSHKSIQLFQVIYEDAKKVLCVEVCLELNSFWQFSRQKIFNMNQSMKNITSPIASFLIYTAGDGNYCAKLCSIN